MTAKKDDTFSAKSVFLLLTLTSLKLGLGGLTGVTAGVGAYWPAKFATGLKGLMGQVCIFLPLAFQVGGWSSSDSSSRLRLLGGLTGVARGVDRGSCRAKWTLCEDEEEAIALDLKEEQERSQHGTKGNITYPQRATCPTFSHLRKAEWSVFVTLFPTFRRLNIDS